jgi:lysophospholipase L1-like esterase
LLLIVLLTVTTASADPNQPADPDPNRFAPEIKTFAEWDSRNAVPAQGVLFAGSSSIRVWRTHDCFPELPVINRGFGGSHISDVLHFAERVVLPYQPRVIVFYAGDNDIAGGKSARRVFDDYRKFARLVHARQPAVRIVFVTIKPSRARWALWPEMKKVNDLVGEFSREDDRLTVADLATPLLDPEGLPASDLFLADQLHLNARGYDVWTRALRPTLQRILASAHRVSQVPQP